jgi:hypothetical protein
MVFQEFYPHGFAGELDLVPEGLPKNSRDSALYVSTRSKRGEKWENFGWVKSII